MAMITVPVTVGFDRTRVIGHLTIDESALPPTPHFTFSLAYNAMKMNRPFEAGQPPRHEDVTEFKLVGIGLIPDEAYLGYLKQTGQADS